MHHRAGTDQACDPDGCHIHDHNKTLLLADSKEVYALLKLSPGASSSDYTALEPYIAMSQWQTQQVLAVSATCKTSPHANLTEKSQGACTPLRCANEQSREFRIESADLRLESDRLCRVNMQE